MSQIPPGNPDLPDGLDGPSPSLVRRRPASVQLSGGGEGPGGRDLSSGDQSTQALGDALRVVYRLIQFGMVVLVGVFLLSGLNKVEEGQRGIRVAFGKDQADDLPPGFQLSLPRPLGDIIKISTGSQSLKEDNTFWPRGTGGARYADNAMLARSGATSLDPESDGFILTGDLSIGHVLASIEYVRVPEKVAQFARRIHPDAEVRIVLGAVRRGIVRAAAGVTIEQFRKESLLQAEAWRVAQAALDEIDSGLEIRSFLIERRMVPTGLINEFERVETSVNDANRAVSEAQQFRQGKLAETVGEAGPAVLAMIDRYESLYTSGNREEAEAVLSEIDAVLSGSKPAVTAKGPVAASGLATQVVEAARSERARAVSRAQSDASLYQAKLEAFKSNPGVVLMGDWVDAYASFVNRDTVQVFMVPSTLTTLDLLLNRDPELQKEQESKATAAEQERIMRENREKLEREALKVRSTGAAGT